MFHQFALYIHIAVGSCALLVFWIPVFTRKGNLDHKRFGKLFGYAMYAVSFSGILMASLDLLYPLTMHAQAAKLNVEQTVIVVSQIRSSALFLLSLSILVLHSTRQGWLAIRHQADRQALRSAAHTVLCVSLAVVGLVLFIAGFVRGSVLFCVFGMFEVVSGVNALRYNFKRELKPKEWWVAHLGGFIGSGIGAYTAFFVFGGRRLFAALFDSAFSDVSIVLWVAPGVIGGLSIAYLSRSYRKRFEVAADADVGA